MDLSALNRKELDALLDQVKGEIKNREVQEIAKAREQILSIAQSVGVPLTELLQGRAPSKNKGQAVAMKYQHPDNQSQGWSGRGRQPKWVKEWVEGGKSLEKLEIQK